MVLPAAPAVPGAIRPGLGTEDTGETPSSEDALVDIPFVIIVVAVTLLLIFAVRWAARRRRFPAD